jgi:rubrerythrin
MSPVTTTTKLTGGTTLLMTPMTVTEPEVAIPSEALDSFLEGSGLNGRFIADLLSSFLVHEQCGFHLYRTASGLTNNPMLSVKYQEFGRQTESHIGILEQLITDLGAKPGYVSPVARLVEGMNTKMLEAVMLLSGSADENTVEQAMLEAVVLAETKDHANWKLLGRLAGELPDGEAKEVFLAAVGQVEAQEDEHLEWASSTWEKLAITQARSSLTQKGMEMAEKAVGMVKDALRELS